VKTTRTFWKQIDLGSLFLFYRYVVIYKMVEILFHRVMT
jgi:hypothetical protein